MKIVHIVPNSPYNGGIETVAGQLCEHLIPKNHNVVWYCVNSSISHNHFRHSKSGILIKEYKALFGDPLYFPSFNFITDLKQENADVIHVHNFHTLLVLFAVFCNKHSSTKLVLQPHYHVHGQSFLRNLFFSFYKKLLKFLIINKFDVVITNSQFEYDVFMKDFPSISSRVTLVSEKDSIYVPANMKWNPSENPKKILCVGKLKKYKNIDKLIYALKILIKQSNNLQLTIVGDGPQKENLKRLARELGVINNIVWKKNLSYNNLLKEYVTASVVVHLSKLESFSRVAHESIAVGAPLVVYDYGVLRAFVNAGFAKGVKNLTPALIAEVIDDVLQRRWIQKKSDFSSSYEKYVDSVEQLYLHLSEV